MEVSHLAGYDGCGDDDGPGSRCFPPSALVAAYGHSLPGGTTGPPRPYRPPLDGHLPLPAKKLEGQRAIKKKKAKGPR